MCQFIVTAVFHVASMSVVYRIITMILVFFHSLENLHLFNIMKVRNRRQRGDRVISAAAAVGRRQRRR
jgi:hypothetical protein